MQLKVLHLKMSLLEKFPVFVWPPKEIFVPAPQSFGQSSDEFERFITKLSCSKLPFPKLQFSRFIRWLYNLTNVNKTALKSILGYYSALNCTL